MRAWTSLSVSSGLRIAVLQSYAQVTKPWTVTSVSRSFLPLTRSSLTVCEPSAGAGGRSNAGHSRQVELDVGLLDLGLGALELVLVTGCERQSENDRHAMRWCGPPDGAACCGHNMVTRGSQVGVVIAVSRGSDRAASRPPGSSPGAMPRIRRPRRRTRPARRSSPTVRARPRSSRRAATRCASTWMPSPGGSPRWSIRRCGPRGSPSGRSSSRCFATCRPMRRARRATPAARAQLARDARAGSRSGSSSSRA